MRSDMVRRAPGGSRPPDREDEEALRRLVLRQVSDFVSLAADPHRVRVVLSVTVA